MAKSEETRERIVMHFETDEDGMGKFAAMLTRMGATGIGWELITETLAYKNKNPANAAAAPRIREIIAKAEGVITARAIRAMLRDEGLGVGGVHYALDKAVADGELQKSAPGEYTKLAGLLTGPKPAPAMTKATNAQKYEVTNWEVIARYVNGRKTIKVTDLRALFKADGRNAKSISSIIGKMKSGKWLKHLDMGVYEVAKRVPYSAGGDTAKKPKRKEHKLNGAAAPAITTEANANG